MEAGPGLWRNQHHSRYHPLRQWISTELMKRFYFSEATDIWELRYISKSSGLPRPHAWFWWNDWMFFGSFLSQHRHNNQALEPTDSWEIISKRQILNQTRTLSPELCLTSLDDNLSIQETVSSNFIDQILEEPDWNQFLDLVQGRMQHHAAHQFKPLQVLVRTFTSI